MNGPSDKPTKPVRSSLPKPDARPPTTADLVRFQDALTNINDLYWASRCGFDALSRHRPPSALRTTDFVDPVLAAHFNLATTPGEHGTNSELDARLLGLPLRLRFLAIVHAVTFYEDYVVTTAQRRLSELPELSSGKPLDLQAQRIVNGRYESRLKDIDAALDLDIVDGGSEHDLIASDLTATFLLRNCIVHAGGEVRQREHETLALAGLSLGVGKSATLTDANWPKLLAALWKHAQDLDVLVRLNYRASTKRCG